MENTKGQITNGRFYKRVCSKVGHWPFHQGIKKLTNPIWISTGLRLLIRNQIRDQVKEAVNEER
jgi:hypothetical protein